MLERHHGSLSHGFRHVHRKLQPGEALPHRPTLIEQVTAFAAERARLELPDAAEDDSWAEEETDELA